MASGQPGRIGSPPPREAAMAADPVKPKPADLAARTDSYFLKSKAIVGRFGDRPATYAVFMRRPVISAPRFAVEFLEGMAKERGASFEIEINHPEGSWVGAGEPILYVTGPLYQLVDLARRRDVPRDLPRRAADGAGRLFRARDQRRRRGLPPLSGTGRGGSASLPHGYTGRALLRRTRPRPLLRDPRKQRAAIDPR